MPHLNTDSFPEGHLGEAIPHFPIRLSHFPALIDRGRQGFERQTIRPKSAQTALAKHETSPRKKFSPLLQSNFLRDLPQTTDIRTRKVR